MLKKRLIAVILVRDGQVVQSVRFKHTNVIHSDPIHAIDAFNKWAIDEIVVLNVSPDPDSKSPFIEIVEHISQACFVPLTAGGWVTSVDDAMKLVANGADKITVNTSAFTDSDLIESIARKLGSQCLVVSIDSKQDEEGHERVAINRGREITKIATTEWAKTVEERGAGELFINSIDHDGNRKGYNLELLRQISSSCSIPIIAMGGVFTWEHLAEGISKAHVDAVAAANIFHYTEHSTKKAKRFLLEQGLPLRKLA